MMEFRTGDLLTHNAEALVNTVNCVGIMGRGVALQFKNAFPDNFKAYVRACDLGEVQPGKMFVFPTRQLHNPSYIVNFPTKRHWKGKSRIEDIESGLADLRRVIIDLELKSLAVPPLGSGLGGLDWATVKQRIINALSDVGEVEITIFEPHTNPKDRRHNASSSVPKMTAGRAALVALMSQYLSGLLDPFVTLLEVHKLLYFLQVSGENLRLDYKRAAFGPYAENLRHVLRDIEGHLVSGYADGGDAPHKRLELVPGAVEDARAYLADHPDTWARFARVAEVVKGFETPFGLELLSTVHWVADEIKNADPAKVIQGTYEWGERKRQFSPEQITLALEVLQGRGLLETTSASR